MLRSFVGCSRASFLGQRTGLRYRLILINTKNPGPVAASGRDNRGITVDCRSAPTNLVTHWLYVHNRFRFVDATVTVRVKARSGALELSLLMRKVIIRKVSDLQTAGKNTNNSETKANCDAITGEMRLTRDQVVGNNDLYTLKGFAANRFGVQW